MTKKNKQRPTCQEPGCLGWMEEIVLRGVKWRRCMSCGFMERSSKREIKPK